MTPRDEDKPGDRERQEAERHLEILRKEAHDEVLERHLKDSQKVSGVTP